ncbi:MAG: carbon storage regulator CsrA [Thermoguttaceae bacterium]|jgi:carbon storage regulator
MVIISRKKNESLVIGDNITVTVIEIREDKVRLGVECPKEMSLHRKEVFDAIHRQETTSPSRADGVPASARQPGRAGGPGRRR